MILSILIVSWNTRELLANCLNSLFTFAPREPFEIIVVDNASTDNSALMMRMCFPEVTLIENESNVGFARANNQAIRLSRGQFVLLLNPDTEVTSGALDALITFMKETSYAGAAGALTKNCDGSLQETCYPRPTIFREFWRLFHLDFVYPLARYRIAKWNTEEPQEVDVLKGACIVLRREVLDGVGLLDENYFMYSEEVDLCYRIQKAGWNLYWIPSAEIIHYSGQSTKQLASEMFLRLYEGKILYFQKHHGDRVKLLYKLLLFGATLVRLGLTPLAWLLRPQIRDKYLSLSGNYQRLLLELPRM